MSDKDNFLLKYFFICGVPEEVKNDLKINGFNENNNINPILLSSYSAEGRTQLFEVLKNKLNEDYFLQNNIFPKKADFLYDVNFPLEPLESPTLEIKTNPFNQYIYTASSFDEMPDPFNHCFQYILKLDENQDDNIILNCTVLIFYENVSEEKDLFKEEVEKQKKSFFSSLFSLLYNKSEPNLNNIFVAKALILISEKPIFSLMREILKYIFNKFIHKKYTYFPLELLIINCIKKINNDNLEDDSDMIKKYKLHKEPLLPYCDLNISFFLNIFTLDDIFMIAEYYLCSKNIIICSTNVEYLFPIYYILMILFFPLNKTNDERFYKLLFPDEQYLQRTIFGMVPTFQFIYNDEIMDEEILKKICKIKEDILIYQIYEDEDNNYEIKVIKNIIRYENDEDKYKKIDLSKYKYNTIIEKVCSLNGKIYNELLQLLKKDIKEINNKYDSKKKYLKYQHFFLSSLDFSEYYSLRNHFIGLFIKFFVTCLNPITFKIDDNKITIDDLQFQKYKNDPNANELLSTLYTTPQSDLIYKNEIIKTCKFENNVLKKIILLDYFLKITTHDKERPYFAPNSPHKTTKKENYLDLKELFNFNNILNNSDKNIYYYINRLYLFLLQQDKENIKDCFLIDKPTNFIERLESYKQLTKDDNFSIDIKQINDIDAYYMIFYGEKFNLHFGQFVNKNKNDFKIDNSNIDINDIDKNKYYEKFYKATLDECQIFYDLFITQIISIENRKQLAACAIGLYVSIYIINLLSELSSRNPYNNKLIKIINRYKEKLYQLFIETKGFYGKYDFLITLLFLIFSNKQFNKDNQQEINLFIKQLENENILPPLITILMYNHNLSLDFRIIKKFLEHNRKINKNVALNSSKTSLFENYEKRKKISVFKSLVNRNESYINYEPSKELLIYEIERNWHDHEYNIMDGINDSYNCNNPDCNEILSFNIRQGTDGEEMTEYVNNPRIILIKILKIILYNNSLLIYSYNDYDDICQIVMLDELYFKIGFFKTPENYYNYN